MDDLDDHLSEALGGCSPRLASVGLRAANQPSERYQLGESRRLLRESMGERPIVATFANHWGKPKRSGVDRQTRVLRIGGQDASIAGQFVQGLHPFPD